MVKHAPEHWLVALNLLYVLIRLHCVFGRRWTPSQALPAPMDPDSLIPLSCPQAVWHLPLADMVADRSAVQHLDVELTGTGVIKSTGLTVLGAQPAWCRQSPGDRMLLFCFAGVTCWLSNN